MGRAKISMKYIQKEKSRKLAFKQRTDGLRNKMSEFSKSGAKACLIVYNDDNNNVGPMTWPKDPTSVNSMLHEYELQKIETPPKIFDVKDYFENKIGKAEAAIIRVRKEILQKKYTTWHPNFNNMEENDLISFITTIEEKIEVCNEKIHMLKNVQQSEPNFLQSTPHVQIMVQEGVTIPQMPQQIHAPMKSNDDISEVVVQENAIIPQMQQQIHTLMKSTDNINEMMDFTNLIDLPPSSSTKQLGEVVKCGNHVANHDNYLATQFAYRDDWINQLYDISEVTVQENAIIPQMQQQIHTLMKSTDDINGMMDFTNLVDLPPSSSTKQLGEVVKCGNQVINHDDYLASEFDDLDNWINQLDHEE